MYSSRYACNWPFNATCLCNYTRYMRAVIILLITWWITDRIGLHSVRPSTSHKCLHMFVMSRSVVQGVRITQQEIQFRLIYNNTCYQLWQYCSDKSSHGRRYVLRTTGTTSEKQPKPNWVFRNNIPWVLDCVFRKALRSNDLKAAQPRDPDRENM